MTDIDVKLHPFISYLETLIDNRAALAELRHGLGRPPGESPGMYPYVIPFIHNPYHEEMYYLIASLFALHPSHLRTASNMGNHLYAYAQAVGDADATTRRFTHLLRQRRNTLQIPLRQHISMLKAKEIAVNWHQLMRDVLGWDHEDHYVQKRWASAFWTADASKTDR